MRFKPFSPAKYRRRIFSQLWMLALQFILGMLLNFIGSDATGGQHTIYIVVLVVHILNAIGLVEGAVYIALKAPGRLAWATAAALTATLVSGVLTAMTDSDIWSFIMASGFLVSSWLYVMLYIRADRQIQQKQA